MTSPERTSSSDDDWLTPGDAARVARVSTLTLARMAARGQVESYKLPSGHRRYSRQSIEALTTQKTA